MDLIFEKATEKNLIQLKELGKISYGQYETDLTEENWNKLKITISSDDFYLNLLKISTCYVCLSDNKIIGMAFLVKSGNPTTIFEADWSYIRMVGVHPRYSGLGIGKKLTTICIEDAVKSDEKIIALHTSEFMNAARHLYEKIGFKIVKEIQPAYGKRYWLYSLKLNE